MKTHFEVQDVERGNIGVEQEFFIAANACSFDILSNGLYSDKPAAIIRELS